MREDRPKEARTSGFHGNDDDCAPRRSFAMRADNARDEGVADLVLDNRIFDLGGRDEELVLPFRVLRSAP